MDGSKRVYLYRRVLNAKLFIDVSYHTDINLEKMSGEASFSRFHFMRIFKTTYGKTPHQYLTWVRIERAKLLLKTDMSVSNVCFSVGFESVSTFTTLFKKLVGKTPAYFQQIQAERKRQIAEAPLRFVPGCFAEKSGWKNNSNIQ